MPIMPSGEAQLHGQGEVLEAKLNYRWKAKLDGVATLQLPADYNRPAGAGFTRGSPRSFSVDATHQRRSSGMISQASRSHAVYDPAISF